MTELRVGDRVELNVGADMGPFLQPGAPGIINELYPVLRATAPGMPTLHDSRNDFVASAVFYGLQRHRPEHYGPQIIDGLDTSINMPVSEAVPVRASEVTVTGNILLEGSNA